MQPGATFVGIAVAGLRAGLAAARFKLEGVLDLSRRLTFLGVSFAALENPASLSTVPSP
jgi:hypothetical protein